MKRCKSRSCRRSTAKFGTPLDVQPEVTVTASNGTTSYDSTSTEGVKLENNVLTITSDAWKQMASTENSTTITIQAHPTDNESLVATKEITLVKAQPVATYLAAGADGTASNLVRGNIFLNHNVVYLPGINETKESLSAAYPVYVMDQYDQPIQNDGKDVTVPAANFKLYPTTPATESETDSVKFVGGNEFYKKNGNEIDGKYAKFEDNSSGGVKLTITNGWDTDNNRLAVPDGHYIIEATYPNPDDVNQPLVARCVIKLTKAPVPTTATVKAARDITVPEKGASEESVNLTATVKDQYGDPITEGVTLAKVGNDIDLYDSNDNHVIKLDNNSTAAYVSEQNGTVRISVSEDLAGYMKRNGTVVTNGELRLPVKVTVGKGENALTFNTTAKVKVSREASALKKATVVMKQGETEVESLPIDVPTTPAPTISRTTPKTTTSYSFAVTGVDQYGDELKDLTVIGGGTTAGTTGISWVNDQKGGYLLNVTSTASGEFDLYIQSGATKQWFYVKFAPMQFFSDDKGTTEYQISDMLDLTTRTYGGELWANFVGTNGTLRKTTENGKKSIYVKEGNESYQELLDGKVKVVVKRGDTEIFDSSKTYAEGQNPKADAGDYTVYIVYVKGENDEYEVCHGSFKIEPKEVTIVINLPTGTTAEIKKEYDGKTDLPTSGLYLSPDGLVGPDANHIDSVSIDPSALKFAKKDAGTGIAIQLVEGKDCLKLNDGTQEGSPATNYTVKLDANGNVEGLTGTITKKKLDVYVAFYSKNWDSTATVGGYTPVLNQSDIVDGETVGVNASLSGNALCFNSSNVGATLVTEKESSIQRLLTGADAGNYEVGEITYGGVNGQRTRRSPRRSLRWTLRMSLIKLTSDGNDAKALAIDPENLKLEGGTSVGTSVIDYINSKTAKPSLFPNSATTSDSGHYNAGQNYPVSVSIPTEDQGNYEIVLNPTGADDHDRTV